VSDLGGWLLFLSPLLLAAALIGFAALGSQLGARRRRIAEDFFLLPLAVLVLAWGLVQATSDGEWLRAGTSALIFFIFVGSIVRRRRGSAAKPESGNSA
jgi:hypothetical protein